MDPNVSFNSLIVPPTIQNVNLEKMFNFFINDINQM